jgi:hypothetical protein
MVVKDQERRVNSLSAFARSDSASFRRCLIISDVESAGFLDPDLAAAFFGDFLSCDFFNALMEYSSISSQNSLKFSQKQHADDAAQALPFSYHLKPRPGSRRP